MSGDTRAMPAPNRLDPLTLVVEEDLELRTLIPSHAPALYALEVENRDALKEWLPWLDTHESIASTKEFIDYAIDQLNSARGMRMGIWSEGRLAGVVNYCRFDWVNRSANLSYWLGGAFGGRGLMTKACGALARYAFQDLNLNRVEIRCAAGNHRSRAIPQRLGFTEEGTVRQAEWLYSHFVDHIVYGLLAQESRM